MDKFTFKKNKLQERLEREATEGLKSTILRQFDNYKILNTTAKINECL